MYNTFKKSLKVGQRILAYKTFWVSSFRITWPKIRPPWNTDKPTSLHLWPAPPPRVEGLIKIFGKYWTRWTPAAVGLPLAVSLQNFSTLVSPPPSPENMNNVQKTTQKSLHYLPMGFQNFTTVLRPLSTECWPRPPSKADRNHLNE